jgi:hypothetical protein
MEKITKYNKYNFKIKFSAIFSLFQQFTKMLFLQILLLFSIFKFELSIILAILEIKLVILGYLVQYRYLYNFCESMENFLKVKFYITSE